jgi:cell division protein ZapA (FtsZ GTPase activity inhibitor)
MISERVEKMGGAGARSASSGQLLALVALELADELEGATLRLQQMEQMTRTAIAHAIARIDGRLATAPKTVDEDAR